MKLQTESVNDVKCWRIDVDIGVAKYTLPKVSTKARYKPPSRRLMGNYTMSSSDYRNLPK